MPTKPTNEWKARIQHIDCDINRYMLQIFTYIAIFFLMIGISGQQDDVANDPTDSFTMDGQYTVTVNTDDDGNLYLRHDGNIGHLYSYIMITYLDKYPDIRYVVLNSIGGQVADSLVVGAEIRERDLPIKVEKGTFCLSSCAFITLYTTDLTIDGQVGFHLPYIPTYTSDDSLYSISQSMTETTLDMTTELFDNGWKLQLYLYIASYSDKDHFVMFDRAEDLNRFRFENAEDFTLADVSVEQGVNYDLRSNEQIFKFMKLQNNTGR